MGLLVCVPSKFVELPLYIFLATVQYLLLQVAWFFICLLFYVGYIVILAIDSRMQLGIDLLLSFSLLCLLLVVDIALLTTVLLILARLDGLLVLSLQKFC